MKAIVVGAGIGGLGAAAYLSKRGHSVEVLEATDRVAGRAQTLERPGSSDRCDVGTQYFHTNYVRALALLREVGLADALRKIQGKTRFFEGAGRGGTFLVDHRLPWIKAAGIGGNLRLAGFVLSRVLRHRIHPYALEERPELDSKLASDVILDPRLREYLLRTLVNVGMLTEPEPAEVCLLQVLRLMRIILLTDYLALPQGVASLHEALARRLAVRREAPVAKLVLEKERVTGVALEGSGEVLRADHVVVAVTPPRAAALVPETWAVERAFLSGVRMPPAVITSFFLDRPLEKGVWSYLVNGGPAARVRFFTDASQKVPAMVPSGRAILQAWVVYPTSATLGSLTDDEVIDACRREAEDRFPGFSSWVEKAHVTRHALGVPAHPVGHHSRALSFLQSAESRKGVSFCGDYLCGGYLEPALWSAQRAAWRAGG
jgi:oxygen-dependent protoporphyrinogen oxidase